MTIVDDHTRATWVYLLKLKSKSLDVIKQFSNLDETQFGKKIKIIISNNALAFDDGPYRKFFADKASYIKLAVLTGHNRMGELREGT